ncbi:hypothetical protein FKM82_028159 [Ascaphus truei]
MEHEHIPLNFLPNLPNINNPQPISFCLTDEMLENRLFQITDARLIWSPSYCSLVSESQTSVGFSLVNISTFL